MVQILHELQILLTAEQYQALAEIAGRDGRSVAAVVGDLIAREVGQPPPTAAARRERQIAALEQIRLHREEILAERGGQPIDIDIVELINQMRTERDEEILGLRSHFD